MPMRYGAATGGGTGYADFRVGRAHNQHQVKLSAAALAASRDADGYLPPGLPVRRSTGGLATAATHTDMVILGPEPVLLETGIDIFGNCFDDGSVNRDMIEDNLGRVLSANELGSLPLSGFKIVSAT